jgi:hypothetical protein
MPSFNKGDRVVQANYGAGTLLEVDEHHTVIEFDQHGRRTFVTRMVQLESTNEPAPARAKAARKPRAAKKPVKKADAESAS